MTDVCQSEIVNTGAAPVALKEVVLFALAHTMPADTPLYGEGFQMLSQTGGTVGAITDLGNYTDAKHYRMPEPAGARVVYNLLTLAAGEQRIRCWRLRRADVSAAQFRLRPGAIEVGARSRRT